MEIDEAVATVTALAGGPAREPNPKKLDELYRSLPRMKCIGECASACGPVQLSPLERRRIESRGHRWVDGRAIPLTNGEAAGTACSALDLSRLVCRVYEDRPMVCRIWGLMEALACPWGCRPEGGFLDDIEGLRLLNSALWYGGAAVAIEPKLYAMLTADPERRAALLDFLERSRPVQEETVILQATIKRRPGL
ncbi:YkgJ family cysteine cluster protein [Streptomyces sp. MMBL 11-1]|uniref:YkgJ family cysteine cluster protein n=1 Tax=Streptomyces sp. MMBL 11-1 TaxID=3026420 RepID=UPI00235EA1FE|nr:YkgJ family cysteine cluster protein [Streptomyces sp. MMBL 11-1]